MRKTISKSDLVEQLINIQKKEKHSDEAMAKRLGCSRQLYQLTRTRKTSVGITILSGSVKAFPELVDTVIYFLTSSANISSK